MKNKRITTGFALCIVGACFLLLTACYWAICIIIGPRGYFPYSIPRLGYALILIFLAVFARKGNRAEAMGILILSCVVPVFVFLTWIRWLSSQFDTMILEVAIFLLSSVFNLIGSIFMLKAIPKANVSVPEVEDKIELDEESSADQTESAPQKLGSPSGTLTEGKTVKRKSKIFMHISRLLRTGKEKTTRFCEKFTKKEEPKWKALVILAAIFVPLSIILILCFASGFFHSSESLSLIFRSLFDAPTESNQYFYDDSGAFIPTRPTPIYPDWIIADGPRMGGIWSLIRAFLPINGYSFGVSPIGAVIILMLIAMLPVYFVYLGMHNPLKLSRGYMFACNTFAATLFLLLDLRMIGLVRAYSHMPEHLLFWTWFFVASTIAAQIFSFFFFHYFVQEETSVASAIVFTVAAEFILPFVAAIILFILLVVLVLVMCAIFVYMVLYAVTLFIKSSDDSFIKSIRGDPVEVKEYTFTTDMGTTMTVYSQDGKKFYAENGAYIGYSDDGGKTIRFD